MSMQGGRVSLSLHHYTAYEAYNRFVSNPFQEGALHAHVAGFEVDQDLTDLVLNNFPGLLH